jgi:cytochrome b pre-mRNA-processing protein 3
MFLDRWLKPRPAVVAGRALYASVAAKAREPAFYTRLGAPDTLEGRFELYTLHTLLILDRLKGQGPAAAETGQALFDTYLRGLDDAFREMGVGDLSVAKKMKKLGQAFYGRVKSYAEAFDQLPERAPLEALVGRTVLEGSKAPDPVALTDYVLATRKALENQSPDALAAGQVSWASTS